VLKDWPTWIADSHPNPEQACAAIEIKEVIRKQIDQLTPRVRSAFCLREFDGFSTKQVGEVLGIEENAAKSRLGRARGQLAKSRRQSFRMTSQDVEDISSRKTMVSAGERSVVNAG
jgi:DNA-directed RNA polymerase specialized sigma24 family protein